jgi:hypothetical protein
MGKIAHLLLVSSLLAAMMLPAATLSTEKKHYVDASDYPAFWLWSGVIAQPALQNASVVYLLQGEVLYCQRRVSFQKLGIPRSKLTFPSLWLTVRVATLEMPDAVLDTVLKLPQQWTVAGNHVIGLQIDFDARTDRLEEYAAFLRRVRGKLGKQYALGVTGLLDWAKTGSIGQLNALPIDELVIQTYQGRTTVPQYERYLPALSNLRVPFKLGLVQNGQWDKVWEKRLAGSSFYRGEVVFLLNDFQIKKASLNPE